MARVRMEDTKLKTWEEVDAALKQIGEWQRSITKVEGKMNEQIDKAKAKAEEEAKPFKDQIKAYEVQVKEFVESNRDDLGNKKTKELNFGKAGFRKSTKISLPKAAAKLTEIIKKLKSLGMTDCIVQPPEKIDKDALKKYPANEIIKVGAGLKVEDVFWYETNEETLAE
ncbi:host-nuclease inhibitor Gam family protein [Cellulosilyticum sp. I15G10I2]|uniref:host-nuclease inhibitor Gam family protein n=1 Tax=Cellulosilyticum sp. I15G10I2 TaxID=1892843 RepID=UPI00085C3F9E|nr:host-nuclease inhibitor Gam family protein [Cellulosilyticum sp. I15G10I2]